MNMHGSVRLAVAAAMLAIFPTFIHGAILSAKRGFADTGANYNNLQATGACWYYTWGTGAANPGNFDAEFDPMFWGWTGQSTINSTLATNPDYILGYNEPERSDQANLSVADAISNWTTISNSTIAYNSAHGTNIQLVSPAVSDTTAGKAWMTDFKNQATAAGLKVDAVAFHWYGWSTPSNPSQAASNFMGSINWYHNLWNKPVFITEFAIHDWGGSYTDAEIIEANRQFLNIVVPWMESSSYVAGYAWYHWFSDAHLYDTPSYEPTVMAYDYIGAVQSSSTADIGGTNLGEHIAYLNGGQLTMTGSAGTVKYLEALYDPNVSTNTSVISGTIDWGPSNWTKIQTGATLRKSGANTISLTSGTVTNNGTLEVSQGVLRLGVGMSGIGSINIPSDGGATGSTARLELTGNISLSNPITFAQRNDPAGSDGIRNVSGNNSLYGPITITVGGNQARVRSDAGLLALSGPITTNATSARNLYLQGAGNGVVNGVISDNASDPNGKINLWKEGAGAWTLTVPSTYSGSTTIAGGTLKFGTTPVTVAHRWSFNNNLLDSVGGSNATVVDVGINNTTFLPTYQQITLTGGARNYSDYVRLGTNLLPDNNTPVTIELWATPKSIQNWSRIFDFGASDAENLFMSWTQGTDINSDRVQWKDSFTNTSDNTNQPYTVNTEYHIVMVLNPLADSTTEVKWYSAPSANADLGSAQGSFISNNNLANLLDSEDNLGRSFYSDQNTANASYNEVRFWNGALTLSNLEILHDGGPNANLNSLNFGISGALPATTAVNITASGATLDLSNLNQTIGSLSGVAGSSVLLGTATLTIAGDASTTFSGVISGSGGLTKNGSGALTLAGDIAYSGLTTVGNGALIITGSSVSIGSAALTGGSLEVDSLSAAMHDITGDYTLTVGNGSTSALLTVDSVSVGSLYIASGAKLVIQGAAAGESLADSSQMHAVPEPAAWISILMAAIASLYWRWRRPRC